MTSESLFDKYGGTPAVSKIVHTFYGKILESDEVRHYFEKIDIERLMSHQVKLFSLLLGGPVDYDVSRLRQAHKSFSLTIDDFEEVKGLLEEALEEADMDEDDVETVLETVESHRGSILNS
jgi:hemoglobin